MSGKPIPPRPGRGALAGRMAEILRVDHAGEMAAVAIYRGQRMVLGGAKGHERIVGQLSEMEVQEAAHLARFDRLLTERQVRPTALAPVWRLAAFALGAGTALMGDKAAEQIAELSTRDPDLAAELSTFRDEEIAHRDLAVEEGAREAPGYALLSAVIRTGCRAAIKVSEKL